MILSKSADTHGKGTYVVTQEVQFLHGAEPFTIVEEWLIRSGESMRLRAYGKDNYKGQIQLTFVYDGKKRFYLDPNGTRMMAPMGNDMFEGLFHFRNSQKMRTWLAEKSVIPAAAAAAPKKITDLKEVSHEDEPFLNLSRFDGFVVFAVGELTPEGAEQKNPGLWIDQNQFFVRRIRFPSQLEVRATKYKKFDQNFWFPQSREVSMGSHRISITTTRVASVQESPSLLVQFQSKSLDPKTDFALKLPEDPIVKDFYRVAR